MNELRIFENPEFGSVRTVEVNGEPWFVGKDVAEILGYTNPSKALSDHVDADDKLNNESLSSLGQRGGWLVNESGLYSLILASKLPTAKKFKRWVTSEVLPSIRQTGMYAMQELSPELRFLISMEIKQKQQEKEMLSMKEDMKRLEAKVTTHNDNYYTIAGYASLRGLNVDISRANMLGRKASKLSREYGYETVKTKDPRFGTVNTYHVDILKDVFREEVLYGNDYSGRQ